MRWMLYNSCFGMYFMLTVGTLKQFEQLLICDRFHIFLIDMDTLRRLLLYLIFDIYVLSLLLLILLLLHFSLYK